MGHAHQHQPKNYNRAFAIAVSLNLVFVVIEAVFGVLAGSLALLADAGHNLSDVFSLLLAWGASYLSTRQAPQKYTYGFRKATVLASLFSAVLLLFALGAIAWEALQRFSDPQAIAGTTVIGVALAGVVINALTAWLFFKGQQQDLNIRAAFLHMAADAGVSLGVALSGLLVLYTAWLWIDPAISLVIVLLIFVSTWGLLKDSLDYALDAVPTNVDVQQVAAMLRGQPQVVDFHDLHVWPLSTTETALTVHLVVREPRIDNDFLFQLQSLLHDRFGIEHATIQVETVTENGDQAEVPCRRC